MKRYEYLKMQHRCVRCGGRDAYTVYAAMVLMLAITMPLWGLPYAVWKKSKERE